MRDKFTRIYSDHIKRLGADTLLRWIAEQSDFFSAPASTRFHLSREGGLCEHSVNVFKRLARLVEFEGIPVSMESVAIIGLLHDLCKANYYAVEMRNRKNDAGQWEKYPFYIVDEKFPYGHGEKSVLIISQSMRLTPEELMAIRWHMAGFDDAVRGGSYSLSTAMNQYPMITLTHAADLMATYIDEKEEKQ